MTTTITTAPEKYNNNRQTTSPLIYKYTQFIKFKLKGKCTEKKPHTKQCALYDIVYANERAE